MDFVPLKVQTRYSPLLSLLGPEEVAGALGRAGIRLAGIADRGVRFGASEARASFREAGLGFASGAEVPVRFPRSGGDLLSSAYTLTFFPETEEGDRNLDLLLEAIWREGRPPRLHGVAEWEEIERYSGGLLALSGGLTGPVSGAFARGRVGDAHRAAARLVALFGPERFFLETTRSGFSQEGVVDPFLRELARRFSLRRVAADPIRALQGRDLGWLRRARSALFAPTAEDPPDHLLAEGSGPLPALPEWDRLYDDDPDALRSARAIGERAASVAPASDGSAGGEELDGVIRALIDELKRRSEESPRWRTKEAEARFWQEFWGIEETGRRAALLVLSRVFRTLRRARPDAEAFTPFLSGSLVGFLAGLQIVDPEEAGAARSLERGGQARIRIEADRESAELLRRLLAERVPGGTFAAIVPLFLSGEKKETAFRLLQRLPGEESGPNPHPPTANPSRRASRGSRGPDPLPEADVEPLFQGAIVGYDRSFREFVWAARTGAIWDREGREEGHLRFVLHESPLLTTLRSTRFLASEGDAFAVIRCGDWAGVVEGGPPLARDLVASLSPRSETDLMLLLASGNERGPRRDLVDRIAAVRGGTRPPPIALPRLAAILRETDGVPFFQEQMVAIIENLTGCPRPHAESIFGDLREGGGAELAGERSLFVRRAADRGVPPDVGARVFSILLTLAPHAACRGDLLPHAKGILIAASRKSLDPVSFAASALNGSLGMTKRISNLLAGFRREGVEFLPIDRNKSGYEFRLEEGAVRAGLAVIPGWTQKWAELFVRERETGGLFAGDADLIGRLAALRFPRAILDEVAKALCAGVAASAPGATPAETVLPARKTGGARPSVPDRGPRTGRRPRSSRPPRRKPASQTAFSFIRRREAPEDARKESRKSLRKREGR